MRCSRGRQVVPFGLSVTVCAILFNKILHYADQTPYVDHFGLFRKVVLGLVWFGLGCGVRVCPYGGFYGVLGIVAIVPYFGVCRNKLKLLLTKENFDQMYVCTSFTELRTREKLCKIFLACPRLVLGVVVVVVRAETKQW